MDTITEQQKKIIEFDAYRQLSDEKPVDGFYKFIALHTDDIKSLATAFKDDYKPLKEHPMRLGFVYPLHVVIDEKIKDLCRLAFIRPDGRIEACEGITCNYKGCPPYSPSVSETIVLLRQATAFLLLQFDKATVSLTQKYIHILTVKIAKALSKKGYQILNTYSCGPCRICAGWCPEGENCQHPESRKFALESCGFWINKLCEKAAENTISGGVNWEIDWIKDWELPSQHPLEFKPLTGILLK